MGDTPNQKRFTTPEIISLASLVVTVLGLGLNLLGYFRPPDPAHPIHFYWLSKSVAIPIWLLCVITIGAGAAAVSAFRHRAAKSAGGSIAIWPINSPVAAGASHHEDAKRQSLIAASPTEENKTEAPTISAGTTRLEINSPDGFVIEIALDDGGDQKGFSMRINNERLQAVSNLNFSVLSAQSYDGRHSAYRDGTGFVPARVFQQSSIQPSCSSDLKWFVRKDRMFPDLLAGDSSGSPLRWPANDKSAVQTWKVLLAVNLQTVPVKTVQDPEPFSMQAYIILTWNMSLNTFLIAQA